MIYALLDCICCKNIALDHGYYPKKTWISSFGISKLGLTEKSSNMSKKFREIDFYCNFTSFIFSGKNPIHHYGKTSNHLHFFFAEEEYGEDRVYTYLC